MSIAMELKGRRFDKEQKKKIKKEIGEIKRFIFVGSSNKQAIILLGPRDPYEKKH